MAKEKHATSYGVVLFQSISSALRAEKLLKKEGIAYKLIPVPRHLSSNCGVCVRIERTDVERARQVLQRGSLDIEGVFETQGR